MDDGPPVPDGLGQPDPFASSSAASSAARPPPDLAFLFPGATPADAPVDDRFCYLCAHPTSDATNTKARELEALWSETINHTTFEAAGMALSLHYDLHLRRCVAGQPEWDPKVVAEHFLLHAIHPHTQRVMAMRIAARQMHQIAETLEARGPDGRLVAPTAQDATTREKVFKMHRLWWGGVATSKKG
jgi:hypothetical protein